MKKLVNRILNRMRFRVAPKRGITIPLTRRQCGLLVTAIKCEINALEAQRRYEPVSEAAEEWGADIDALNEVLGQIVGSPYQPAES
jgi:hypothetical protein